MIPAWVWSTGILHARSRLSCSFILLVLTEDPCESVFCCLSALPGSTGRAASSLPGMSAWHFSLQREKKKKKKVYFFQILQSQIEKSCCKGKAWVHNKRVCVLSLLILNSAGGISPFPNSQYQSCCHVHQPGCALLSHTAPRSSAKFLAQAFNQLLGWVLQFKEHQPGSEERILPSPEPSQTSVWSWMFPRRGRV